MTPEDDEDVSDAVRQHHAAPEPPLEAMWRQVRPAIPRAIARRRRHRLFAYAAGIAALVALAVTWPHREALPVALRVDALRDSVSELDVAIRDLDAILRSDPANPVVMEMRARFDRQRNAWLARRE